MTRKTSTKSRTTAKQAPKGPFRPNTRRTGVKARPPAPGGITKQARLIALLRGDRGTTIGDAAKALSWQHHSIRGLLYGVLKKKLKLKIEKLPDDGSGTRYRIVG